jgi:hypothetical protein
MAGPYSPAEEANDLKSFKQQFESVYGYRMLISKHSLFPTHVSQHRVSNAKQIKDFFLPLITSLVEENKEEIHSPDSWFRSDLLTSFSNKKLNDELFSNNVHLKSCFNEVFEEFFEQKAVSGQITHTWFNYYCNDSYQEWHNHVGNEIIPDLSFVFFLSYDHDNHGPLLFKDPLHCTKNLTKEGRIFNYNSTWAAPVREGDMVIFPAYLEHSVKPGVRGQKYALPRITISGNVLIE